MFDVFIDKLIYSACDGRPTDIKTLERGSYMSLLSVLDNYLDKVERHNKAIEELNRKNKRK